MKINRKICGIGGLFCPGLGQLLAGQFTQAFFAFGSVSIPLIWLGFLLNQMVIRQGLWPAGESTPTILDLTFITSFPHINNVPPPYYVLFVLTVIIHIWTMRCAWRGEESHPDATEDNLPSLPSVVEPQISAQMREPLTAPDYPQTELSSVLFNADMATDTDPERNE